MTLKLKRDTVRQVACPHCGAQPGEPCYSYGGHSQRVANHKQRVQVAAKMIGTNMADESRRARQLLREQGAGRRGELSELVERAEQRDDAA